MKRVRPERCPPGFSGSLEELSNVDLGEELTSMIPTRHNYEANIKALKANQDMEDQVLDLIG